MLTVREASEISGCSERGVQKALSRGAMLGGKEGTRWLISEASFQKWVALRHKGRGRFVSRDFTAKKVEKLIAKCRLLADKYEGDKARVYRGLVKLFEKLNGEINNG